MIFFCLFIKRMCDINTKLKQLFINKKKKGISRVNATNLDDSRVDATKLDDSRVNAKKS